MMRNSFVYRRAKKYHNRAQVCKVIAIKKGAFCGE